MRSNSPLRIPLSKQIKTSGGLFIAPEVFVLPLLRVLKEAKKDPLVNHIDTKQIGFA